MALDLRSGSVFRKPSHALTRPSVEDAFPDQVLGV